LQNRTEFASVRRRICSHLGMHQPLATEASKAIRKLTGDLGLLR
jgi:hypothetical protein